MKTKKKRIRKISTNFRGDISNISIKSFIVQIQLELNQLEQDKKENVKYIKALSKIAKNHQVNQRIRFAM